MKRLQKRKSSNLKKGDFSQSLLANDHLELQQQTQNPLNQKLGPTGAYQPPSSTQNQPAPVGTQVTSADVNAHSPNFLEEGYRWDFCIVVANPNFEYETPPKPNENKLSYEDIMERLYLAHLQTFSFLSGDGDEIYIKIRAPLHRLQEHAEKIGYSLLLDSNYCKRNVDNKSRMIADDPSITPLTPYQYIYASYSKDRPDMFAKAYGLNHPFSALHRIKLIMDIIQSDDDGCCALNLRKLVKDGEDDASKSMIAFYPLHDDEKRKELSRIWFNGRMVPWEQPLDEVKEYLGEKIALYFEFTAHYTTWLLPLAIGGALVTLDMVIETGITGSIDTALVSGYSIPFYCIFVSFWSQLMIEYWKRNEAKKAMEWGMSNFEDVESERPEFYGTEMRSIIDGKTTKYFEPSIKLNKLLYSYLIIGSMMLLVLACVSLIFFLQYIINDDINDDSNKSSGNTGVSILSAIQIIVLNSIYSDMAIKLTDQENHRTDTEYDDSLIGKLFAFSFINSYASLFFIAYIKHNLGEACQGPCMAELAYQLAVIFASKLTIDKITTYITLVLNRYLAKRAEEKEYEEARKAGKTVNEPSKAELEKRLEEYDPSLGVLQDYAQIFIQFGYVTLFVSACPVAPILAYFSNLIEIRSDGFKLLNMMRRAVPTGAQDIGTWLSILQMTAVISVVTNAAILCFTMQLLNFSGIGTVWLFIGFQYAIFITMGIFSYVVEDVPEEVTIQLKRQEYLAERAEMTEEEIQEENEKMKGGQRPQLMKFDPDSFKPKEIDEDEKNFQRNPMLFRR